MSNRENAEAIDAPLTDLVPESGEGEGERLFCRLCGALITSETERLEVDGGHRHTFVNPAGYIHRIGCFRDAAGCAAIGVPTNEFTWFAGYAWRLAVCRDCGNHLGWAYSTGGSVRFFGLILSELRRGSQSSTGAP